MREALEAMCKALEALCVALEALCVALEAMRQRLVWINHYKKDKYVTRVKTIYGVLRGFSVVAPELAVPGKTTAVLVTLHGPTSLRVLNVTLKLLQDPSNEDRNQQPIETTQEIKGHGVLPLEIPAETTGNFILQTLVNCTETDVCELQSSSQMRLVGPVRDVIIRPARHTYSPGETITFWVLALNHELQIAADAIAIVSVKDPAGTKVALWYQVALDEGIKSFSLPLSEYARLGRWLIHVEVESAEFSAAIDVAPGAGSGLPDVAAAEEHYVELRFGREMRRRYKPGLPFVGKVEAMSTEKSVRVRVKVYDNSTSIYSQDIEISAGEGTFVVPAIMADSDVIALQAELVSVEGKEIESHYVLAREPVYKWNSSSDCYLLIEGVEHTLQPEEEAHVVILSTCPCERDLHYVITTDGRVTDWAQRRYEDPVPPTTTVSAVSICRLNFSFTVRSIMAPVSQLLVYYVTSQGEPVSDVISFDVKLLNRQVYVSLEEKEWWLPGQNLDVEVVAEASALVCLLGGRYRSSNDIKFDPRVSEERVTTVTGEVDFLEAGVSFFQRQCVKRENSEISAVSYRQQGSGAGPSNRRRPPESLVGGAPFDQLWLWKCFNYTSEIASTGLTISAPQEAGKWSLWALTVASGGLRFSSPINVQVFRPLQADFHLPPSLRIGETLEVDIKIANNINSCMDVTALLALSEGAQFLSNGLLYVTERLRLGPQGATSLVVRLLVTTSGIKNMTVEVNGYTSPSCEGSQTTTPNSTLAGAVMRSATVMVYPEGQIKTDTESAYFCANENMIVSTADNFKYEWIGAPRNRAGLVLEIKAGSSGTVVPVHIALSESRLLSDRMYRLTLGDAENTITWLGRGKHEYSIHLVNIDTPDILSADHWRTFWLSWEKNTITFGNSPNPNNNTILKWKMDKKIKIQQIGFASAWGSTAEFRVWNFNDESGFSQVLHLDTPKSLVPGSESGELLIAGGLALPELLKNKEGNSLAEALASLVPILKLKHLGIKVNESEKINLLKALPKYIQTILSYRKPDNSFSEHQMVGSHKSTVSILKALIETQTYFSIDPDVIQEATRWIQLRQEDDGSFTPLPADINHYSPVNIDATKTNSSIKNFLLDQIAEITAETLITFHEYPVESLDEVYIFGKATSFLESVLPKIKNSEAIAAVTLALVLYRSKKANRAIEILKNSSTTDDGEFGWPHILPKRDAANWLYEAESSKTLKEPLIATFEDYKASIYSLWTFCQIGDLKFAESVARFLFYRSHMLDKHSELLYSAVRAFSHFDTLVRDQHRSLTISLATSGMELTDTLELKVNKEPQVLHLPSLPTKVFVYATGAGCATIQGKIMYSTYSVSNYTSLMELWSSIVQEILPEHSSLEEIEGKLPMLKIKHCFRWKGSIPSGVLRLEVTLFSGFELAPITQIVVTPTESMAEMQHGYFANNLWFVFANVSTTCPICVQYIVQSNFIISSLRPAYARIYPASREDLAAETFFHTYGNSNLLKGITDDDLITWFGKNTSWPPFHHNVEPSECIKVTNKEMKKNVNVTNKPQQLKIPLQINNNTLNPFQKLDNISIATYTINVDNNSISNLTEKDKTIIPTTVIVKEDMKMQKDLEKTKIKINKSKDTIITSENVTNINKHKDNINVTKEITNVSKSYNKPERLITNKHIAVKKFNNTLNHTEGINKVMKRVHVSKQATSTGTPATTNAHLNEINTKFLKKDLNQDHSPSKHINTVKQELPTKYFPISLNEDEIPAAFAPEMKNNRYILLDKNELWGMLKEAVNDEMNKKQNSFTNIDDDNGDHHHAQKKETWLLR